MVDRSGIDRRIRRLSALVAITLIALGAASAGASAAVSFAPRQDIAVGPGPVSIAVGDFDRNAKPDLAVTNATEPGVVAVVLGDGSGSFGAPTTFPIAGNYPSSVAVGDFNGDGNPDLAVTDFWGGLSSSDTYASVMLGDGAGSFGAAAPFLVSLGLSHPLSVSTTDVNADGRPDLVVSGIRVRVVAPTQIGDIVTLLGDGAGSFARVDVTSSGEVVRSLAVGDLNGDGKPDLATARSGRGDFTGRAEARLGDGGGGLTGTWGAEAGTGSTSVAIADFNGDARPDLAVANFGSNDVSVFLGDGGGGFGAPTSFAAHDGPRSVVADDFDGDGTQDLAVANAGSRDVSVLAGLGTGAFAAPVHFATGEMSPTSAGGSLYGDGGRLRAADFDCNGTQDLAVANDSAGTVSVLMNARAGTKTPGCASGAQGGGDTAVDAKVSAVKTQRQRTRRIRVKVKVAAREGLTARATGKIRLAKRFYKLRAVSAKFTAGQSKTLILRPRRKRDQTRLVKALRRGKRAKATVRVVLTDLAANTKSQTLTVTLKR